MIKKITIFFVFVFAIMFFPKDVFAETINVFDWKLHPSNMITDSDFAKIKKELSINDDTQSVFVIKTDSGYSAYVYNDTYIPLASYVLRSSGYYNLRLLYDTEYCIDSKFEKVNCLTSSWNWIDLYSDDNYEALIQEENNLENVLEVDFPIVASNSTFKLTNNEGEITDIVRETGAGTSSYYDYIPIEGKKVGSNYLLPFNSAGVLVSSNYSKSKSYTFNSNEYSTIKIYYDVLQGTVDREIESKTFWMRWLGLKDRTKFKTDTFHYTISSTNEIKPLVRYYSMDGLDYKRLPLDIDSTKNVSFDVEIDDLQYDEGVRKGYLLIDLSDVPADTEISIRIDYNPVSFNIKGVEKTHDINLMDEFDFSNYYAIGLMPKFDIYSNNYSYPVYYKGNVGFGLIYNDNLDPIGYVGSNSENNFSKYILDFSMYNNSNRNMQNAFYYVRNLNFGKENSTVIIKYSSDDFDIVTFENEYSSVEHNGHVYYATNTDGYNIGTIDPDGWGNNIGTTGTSAQMTEVPSLFDSFDDILASVTGAATSLLAGFTFIGTFITMFFNAMPTEVKTAFLIVLVFTIIWIIKKMIQ